MRLETLLWALSGPSRFLDGVEADLEGGRSILFLLPQHPPVGLRAALAERIARTDNLYFRSLDVDEPPGPACPPARLIHEVLAPLGDPLADPTPTTVAAAPQLEGAAVWIEGVTGATWPAWRRFLLDYKDCCRVLPSRSWPRLMLSLRAPHGSTDSNGSANGDGAADGLHGIPAPDVTLEVRRWEGVISRLDMLIYGSRLTESIPPTRDDGPASFPLFRELSASIITELAGTDPTLACILADGPLEQLLAPVPLLQRLAAEWGWEPASRVRQTPRLRWARGMLDYRDGRPLAHPVAEVAAGQAAQVLRRVWRGEVGVLFPFLEEVRAQFTQTYARFLTVPFPTMFERISRKDDMELNHIYAQLQKRGVAPKHMAPVACCTRIRNDLAHLRPARVADLLGPDFLQVISSFTA